MTRPTDPADPFFDDRIADWLETDPQRAPDPVLDTILAAVPSIPQRRHARRPWRFPDMTTPLKLAAGAVVIVAIGALAVMNLPMRGGVGTPSSSPTAAPASIGPSATIEAVVARTSDQYGYTVRIPERFEPTPATADWPLGAQVATSSLFLDRYFATNPAGGGAPAFLGIASQDVGDVAPGDWMADHAAAMAAADGTCTGYPVTAWQDATVLGVAARRLNADCAGYRIVEVVFVVDGRGWIVSGDAAIAETALENLSLP